MLKNNQSYYVMVNESTLQFYIGKCQIKADCKEYFKKALRAINPELKAEDFIDITFDVMHYCRAIQHGFDEPTDADVDLMVMYVAEYDKNATLLNRQRIYQEKLENTKHVFALIDKYKNIGYLDKLRHEVE